jgi:Protein of unknown function (DUF3501)
MKLTLDDISDARAYEREREEFRSRVVEVKSRRRLSVGPYVTILFENRETVRFQIQEMARVERIYSDEGIQTELDIYNALVPDAGQLCLTLFIELTTELLLREWLPKLVGIERHVTIRLADGTVVRAAPEADHAERLTRDDITSTVHYLFFQFTADEVDGFAAGGSTLVIDHGDYHHETPLTPANAAELLIDLRG